MMKVLPSRIGKAGRLALFAAVVAIVSIPRLMDLDRPGMSCDETVDYTHSVRACQKYDISKPVSDGYLNGQLPFSISCLLYKVFGAGELVSRSLSAAFSIISIALLFMLARAMLGYWWALASAALYGLSALSVSSARLAFSHGHGLSTPFIIIALYFLWLIYSDMANSKRMGPCCAAAGLSAGLAVGTDLLAGFWMLNIFAGLWYAGRGQSARIRLNAAALFMAGSVAGLFIASPMYFIHPLAAVLYVRGSLAFWDGLRGFLWLGHVVDRIPPTYYLVVSVVKCGPALCVLIVSALAAYSASPRFGGSFRRFLALSCWPVLYLSFKGWKSPYYLSIFLPVAIILAASLLSKLFGSRPMARKMALKVVLLTLVYIEQIRAIIYIHPDYLMSGIEYGKIFYGEFQGPAVSHGQWIGEALKYIRERSGNEDPKVLISADPNTPQIRYYAMKYGLHRLAFDGDVRDADYVVITEDAKRMRAPLHPQNVEKHKPLIRFMESAKDYDLIKTFSSGSFPMINVSISKSKQY